MGILETIGRSLLQLGMIVGCVVVIRIILQKTGQTKGPGISLGWSADQEAERRRLGLEEDPSEK